MKYGTEYLPGRRDDVPRAISWGRALGLLICLVSIAIMLAFIAFLGSMAFAAFDPGA